MEDFDEENNPTRERPNDQKFGNLRESLIHLISRIDPAIDWSKVNWDHQEGNGFGSCSSDDLETTRKLEAAYYALKRENE
ncbi:MAG: hypothetical protein EOO01_05845 [Chitinophagaceae bacterium]|nr:MAG: hypothetical protein EOO01_05845 [Chitinophagaceae bacterium]